MGEVLRSYFGVLTSLLVLDGLWLGLVAKNAYTQSLGHLMRAQPLWFAAALFYIIYTAGLVFLIVLPAQQQGVSAQQLLLSAFVFGLVAYATYDLTNLTVIKDWPIWLSVIDIAWGGILTAAACWIAVRFLA